MQFQQGIIKKKFIKYISVYINQIFHRLLVSFMDIVEQVELIMKDQMAKFVLEQMSIVAIYSCSFW